MHHRYNEHEQRNTRTNARMSLKEKYCKATVQHVHVCGGEIQA